MQRERKLLILFKASPPDSAINLTSIIPLQFCELITNSERISGDLRELKVSVLATSQKFYMAFNLYAVKFESRSFLTSSLLQIHVSRR
jgi:hypothetical protein